MTKYVINKATGLLVARSDKDEALLPFTHPSEELLELREMMERAERSIAHAICYGWPKQSGTE